MLARRCTVTLARFQLFRTFSSDEVPPPLHPHVREPDIPPFVERPDEETGVKRARLLYQSRKRGMLENDLLLSTFADKYLDTFNEEKLKMYDILINMPSNDWDIYYWATGVREVPPAFKNEVMDLLKQHTSNENREKRIRQPDLKEK